MALVGEGLQSRVLVDFEVQRGSPMAENPDQQTFFIQDPFTEEVEGPLTPQQLKQWFAQGSVEDWGVSKSPDGPWTSAAQVKGLAAAASPPPRPPPLPAAAGGPSAGGGAKMAAAQTNGTGTRKASHEEDSGSISKIVRDVFSPITNRLVENKGEWPVWKLLLVGAVLGLVGLVGIAGVGVLAASVLGASGPSEARQRAGEVDGVYRNRLAKEIFAGTWETEADHNDTVFPDGSRGGIDKQRMVLAFLPSEGSHGPMQTMSSNGERELAAKGCYTWEVLQVKKRFLGGPVARFRYYPTECPDAPAHGTPSYELMQMRLESSQSMKRPVYEFVIKDKDTLVQKDATPFEGPHVSFGDQIWRRVR